MLWVEPRIELLYRRDIKGHNVVTNDYPVVILQESHGLPHFFGGKPLVAYDNAVYLTDSIK
jgi:hypothetical protein